ncbi:hypothetical protein BKA62DRAFT_709397 [Auriculariales sp. MPI-PUGE-AT-0066]|nr:hypothetical protein BKA62DRAFT_709397 [Auriculariales sp. MPI-PUGE-AT-0066]
MNATNARAIAQTLISQRDDLRADLDAQYEILKANNCTGSEPLVDAAGFPRADVDIYSVRRARVRIIELRNDLTRVTDDIAKALEGVFVAPVEGAATEPDQPSTELQPFAKVDGVAPNSPAASAGLQRGDLIIKFGTLTAASFVGGSLAPLVEMVGANENRAIPLKVARENSAVFLSLTPRSGWGGRGMLGCHIVPHRA